MNSPLFIIPVIMTDIYHKMPKEEQDKITILPKDYFSPYDSGGGKPFEKSLITENTYAIHWFSYSWGNFDSRKFLSVKHIKNPIKRKIAQIKVSHNFKKEQKIKRANYIKNVEQQKKEK